MPARGLFIMKLSGAMSFLADSLWEEQKKKSGVGKSGGGGRGERDRIACLQF